MRKKLELATDTHRLTQTFVRRTSPDKNSHRFAKKNTEQTVQGKSCCGKDIFITLDGIPLLGYSCKKGYDYDQELWQQDNRKDF